ncbi:hypothetical protein RZS28_17435 [Methylocapsa polymorpha]|uniref:Uncharacterized protein n=1 Tax=Methylocapsa polymorpha TaxID=3080828 RepID=A0ABZ0HRJ9_9HYPH|nr:hypothetical protein RZS28_17435 [Methylocapsa sp. RX1]
MQPRRANAVASRQKITGLFDKPRFRRAAGAKQQNLGAARRLNRKTKPLGLGIGFDQAAARMIGDGVEPLPARSRDRDIAEKPFDIGCDQRAERSRQTLNPIDAGASGRFIFAKDDG